MKTFITIIAIIGLQLAATAQKAKTHQAHLTKISSYLSLTTPPVKPDYTKAKFTPSPKNSEITITSLPQVNEALTTVNMDFALIGSFTFKKDAALQIPFNQEVFIEDKLTGKIFNIKTSDAYTFTSEENIPTRFVMHILDKTESETIVTVK